MAQYDVGDILWIVHTDKAGLMAWQVVEEITKKTLKGEIKQFLISPASSQQKTIALDKINGRVFRSREEAKEAMLSNANKAIDNMLAAVQENVNRFFNVASEQIEPQQDQLNVPTSIPLSEPDAPLPEGYQWVEMDGKKVKVKLPDSLI